MNDVEPGSIRRVLVALDPNRESMAALSSALLLADCRRVELVALLIEDEALLQLAALPFIREVRRDSGTLDPLDRERLAATLRRSLDKLQRSLLDSARARNLRVSVQTLRGRFPTVALDMLDTDVLVFGMSRHSGVSLAAGITRLRLPPRPQPIWVLYDDSPAARRALALAEELARPETMNPMVLLHAATGDTARRMQDRLVRNTDGSSGQYLPVTDAELPTRLDAIRRQGCRLLVLPRSSTLLQHPDTLTILDGVGCPVVLVN